MVDRGELTSASLRLFRGHLNTARRAFMTEIGKPHKLQDPMLFRISVLAVSITKLLHVAPTVLVRNVRESREAVEGERILYHGFNITDSEPIVNS